MSDVVRRQSMALGIGAGVAVVTAFIDYRHIERFGYVIYTIGVFSLVLVSVLATDVRGGV